MIMWFAFVANIFLWHGTVLGRADKSFTQIVFQTPQTTLVR